MALVLIGILTEGTKKHFLNDFGQLMDMVLPYLNSQNDRVAYSGITCIGMLCEEFSPHI